MTFLSDSVEQGGVTAWCQVRAIVHVDTLKSRIAGADHIHEPMETLISDLIPSDIQSLDKSGSLIYDGANPEESLIRNGIIRQVQLHNLLPILQPPRNTINVFILQFTLEQSDIGDMFIMFQSLLG